MRLQGHPQEQIAGPTAIPTVPPLSRQADQLAVTNAAREVDVDLMAVQGQPPPAASQRVLKRQVEKRLAVATTQGSAGVSGPCPEQGLEEVITELHAGAICEPLVGDEVLEALLRRSASRQRAPSRS